jgi:hypothetical protein
MGSEAMATARLISDWKSCAYRLFPLKMALLVVLMRKASGLNRR